MIDKSVSEVCASKHWHPDYTVFIVRLSKFVETK